jgi:hypothetical protein
LSKSEIIHCPNCSEDVPKTLYCLNCGYPLYKLEVENKTEDTPAVEAVSESEAEVDMSVEYEPPTETFIEEPEPIPEPEPEPEVELEVEEAPEPLWDAPQDEEDHEVEPEPEPVVLEEPEPEVELEEAPEPLWEAPQDEEDNEVELEPVWKAPQEEEIPEVEPEQEPIPEPVEEVEPEPVYEAPVESETVFEPAVEPVVITKDEREEYMMNEVIIDFAPDPLTKEVMENLAKNITLKIRLTKLLRENAVKEETFKKLFDSYVDQGRLWISRRDDIIRRLKSDNERMEQELVSARKDFELLEIRKNIGDAGDDEYGIKAPAYKWDIEHLDSEIKTCTGGLQYMINLRALVPEEEVASLEKLAQTDYSEVENIEGVTVDTIARMKETLAEALNTLQG